LDNLNKLASCYATPVHEKSEALET
jgi:hypothetical protein